MGIRQTFRALLYGSPIYPALLRGRVPAELRGTPPDPWPGDIGNANAILAGEFVIAGRRLPADWTAWSAVGPVAATLNGFSWLRDLRALANDEARQRGRTLTREWIESHRRWSPIAWRPDVTGERLYHWFASYGFLARGAEAAFTSALLESAARQARHLRRALGDEPRDARAFLAVKGLLGAAVCLPGQQGLLDAGLRALEGLIARQILPDGGHMQRNPTIGLDVLRQLVDVRLLLGAAHVEPPTALQNAIDRMAPMARCLRHGDGRLPLVNGSDEGDERDINMVLAQTGSRGKPLLSAPHSGFYRLAAGRTILLIDAGPPPPSGFDHGAHAGALSFEMSVGKERLIVNCGSRAGEGGDLAHALRATAAHSTVVVDDVNSSEIVRDGGIGRRPANVAAARREVESQQLLEASHDGYAGPFGLVHRRLIYLAADGGDVRGEDSLLGKGGRSFAARFHLHPKVQASLVHDGSAVILRLATSEWRFRASGGAISLEDSVYAGSGAVRRATQIVVSGPLGGEGAVIKWRLSREGGKE